MRLTRTCTTLIFNALIVPFIFIANDCYSWQADQNSMSKSDLNRKKGAEYDLIHETKAEAIHFENGTTGLSGPYLGQETPGLIPRLFAPGIISTAGNIEFGCTFSNDMSEFYFSRRSQDGGRNVIMVSRMENGAWSEPDTAWFSNGYSDNEPFITPDGKRFYFGSVRQENPRTRPLMGIWYMEIDDGEWSEPAFLRTGMYVSSTCDGKLYLSNASGKPDEGISLIDNPENDHSVTIIQTGGVNNPTPGFHPCVSPANDFIIFDCYREDSFGGEADLYISYRTEGGDWSNGINMGGEINSIGTDFAASLSPDGRYIFFTRNRDIYWVSSDILIDIRKECLK